jgi:hypothetical protein
MSERNSEFMCQFSEEDFLSLKVSSVKNSLASLGEYLCSLRGSLRLSCPDYSFTFLSSCVSFHAPRMSLIVYSIQVYGAHTNQSLFKTASGSLNKQPGACSVWGTYCMMEELTTAHPSRAAAPSLNIHPKSSFPCS